MSHTFSSRQLGSRAVARNYFGTDGVRGIVGEFITPDLLERLGKASALWSGRGRVFVGRDTRASGEELEEAFARGVASAGGSAVLAGVVPTPAVALLRLDLGVVISASHNPPEYNGVKFFDRDGHKLSDAAEEEIEALLDAPATGGGEIDHVDVASRQLSRARPRAVRLGPRAGSVSRSTARTARTRTSRRARSPSSAPRCTRSATSRTATNINVGCGATDLAALQRARARRRSSTSASPSTATATGCSRSTRTGASSTATRSSRSSRLHLGVDLVAVTTMTNLGFHRLMDERGVRVITTDVGDRYVLEALLSRGRHPRRRAVGPHHLPARPRHGRRARVRAAALRGARGDARCREAAA